MNINTITAEDLRRMPDKEGLILQGCGGDLTEWVDGINEMLTKAGILKDGCQFENVAAFQHGELTCLLYPFDDVKLDIGKLALWRLQTHEVYGGTWLSDFVPNYLGGFIETPEALADKPDCPLIGADGNIFNLLGIASRTLREHGLKEQAKEMSDRVFVSGSYGEALCIIGEYVNITDSELEHTMTIRTVPCVLSVISPTCTIFSMEKAGRIPRRKCWNEGLPCASMKNLRDCKMGSLHSLPPKEKSCLPDSRFRRRKVIFAMRNFMRKDKPATTICWMAG